MRPSGFMSGRPGTPFRKYGVTRPVGSRGSHGLPRGMRGLSVVPMPKPWNEKSPGTEARGTEDLPEAKRHRGTSVRARHLSGERASLSSHVTYLSDGLPSDVPAWFPFVREFTFEEHTTDRQIEEHLDMSAQSFTLMKHVLRWTRWAHVCLGDLVQSLAKTPLKV